MKYRKLSKYFLSMVLVIALVLNLAVPAFAVATDGEWVSSDEPEFTLNLMADASLRYTLGERQTNEQYPSGTLLNAFENEYGIAVNVTYDSSGNLLNQMIADSTRSADVFISADVTRMNSGVTAGIIKSSTVYNLLNNKLVLVANANAAVPNNLTYAGVPAWLAASNRSIAIADPAVCPSGSYTKKVFQSMDTNGAIWNSVLAKTTLYTNVTQVLNAVAAGTNPIGSVYATDAATNSSLVKLESRDVNIIHPIGITTAAMVDEDRAAIAQNFVYFLKEDLVSSASVFKSYGFGCELDELGPEPPPMPDFGRDTLRYSSTSLESAKNETLRVSMYDDNISKARDYYVEAFCSWDNNTWYSKGGANLTIPAGSVRGYTNLEYCLFFTGQLYTKVVVYSSQGGTELEEIVKQTRDTVTAGVIPKYDWYQFSETYENNLKLDGYLSDIGGAASEAEGPVYAITKKSDESVWRQYLLSNGVWTETGTTYATDPVQNGSVGTASAMSTQSGKMVSPMLKAPSIDDIRKKIEKKKNELLKELYKRTGIDPAELDSKDLKMIAFGLSYSIDENVYFGVAYKVFNAAPSEDSYYFMKARAFGDSVFTAAYTTAALGSAAEAARALSASGVSGAMALATSPTGAGGVGFGAVAVGELAESGAMAGVSFVSGKMAARSQGILTSTVSKLQWTDGYKIRSVGKDIISRFEGYKGSHTIKKHVSMTNEELIRRANQEGFDATSFSDLNSATSAIQHNLRKNADDIEKWLKNSTKNQGAFEVTHQYSVGYGVRASSTKVTYNLTKTKVILMKDDTVDLGFYILTSYPIF